MDKLKCPKCGSINVQKASKYAHRKFEGEPASKKSHDVPNQCKDCEYTWDEKILCQ